MNDRIPTEIANIKLEAELLTPEEVLDEELDEANIKANVIAGRTEAKTKPTIDHKKIGTQWVGRTPSTELSSASCFRHFA